ncbi:MAG: imelysin family protein [Pseudomonadota bacterium]
MRRLVLLLFLLPCAALASPAQVVDQALETHILPGFADLESKTKILAELAANSCDPDDAALRDAYHTAFDAWVTVSHLRFGPSEADSRGFALAFWPDPRGTTAKTLGRLIRSADPAINDPDTFRTVSVAARGFYAMERLLYDPAVSAADPEYACRLLRALTVDMAETATLIRQDWIMQHADLMRTPGTADNPYANELEALKALYSALGTGLEFAVDIRMGRPLGTFDRPRPRRAEAWRSGRSLRQISMALDGMEPLAAVLATDHAAIAGALKEAFGSARDAVADVGDPVFATVSDPVGRLKVEILQQRIDYIREIVLGDLGPALGVGQGFNALDGD